MYSDLNTTNNNLSNKFAAKDISNGSLNQITTTGFYFGSNITEVTPYIKSHKWCLINAYVSGNSASIFVIAGDAIALSIYRNGDGIYSYYPIATKSDLTDAIVYRGVLTGDLDRASSGGIETGYYTIRAADTVSNAPEGAAWCTFVQFSGDYRIQLIIQPNFLATRRYAGSPVRWTGWSKYSES